ncbi:hypothetical protein CC1G_13842 [Coprinopsis cinerea okayama7|uniref:Uncharacterized protein n=1 Tax=Coprinopsis cinerea (strain Okayama-7 / 130 / ATCC MYA-4618 / FGSC 9003) TaxID=240176 RepID=D6RKK4_COPC7|nr:hypothetical protein CC1G_13842 [Coprinopsis cinerea okayama7\|eukprot:XP_002911807.1 hypothetical protein CC1G_13842 [Coprinopsis cinerea okayama7\
MTTTATKARWVLYDDQHPDGSSLRTLTQTQGPTALHIEKPNTQLMNLRVSPSLTQDPGYASWAPALFRTLRRDRTQSGTVPSTGWSWHQRLWDSVVNNWPLCESPPMPEGEHSTLTLNVTIHHGTRLHVDQVRFLPSTSSNLLNPVVFIEQVDPAVRSTSGTWQVIQSNAMMTLESGATMRIDFSGTKATWIGWAPNGYPSQGSSTGTYVLDGADPARFTVPGVPPGVVSASIMYFSKLACPRQECTLRLPLYLQPRDSRVVSHPTGT